MTDPKELADKAGLILDRDSDGFWSLYPDSEELWKIRNGTARPLRVGCSPNIQGNWTRPDARDIRIALFEHSLRQAGE